MQNRPWVENLSMDTLKSTQEQLNKIIEFRQTVYNDIFMARRDAQFELVDALLSKGKVASFPWLSTAGCFQRQWPSLYDAIEAQGQAVAELRRLLLGQVPEAGVQFWWLAKTAWPHPQTRTLPEREYVYQPRV